MNILRGQFLFLISVVWMISVKCQDPADLVFDHLQVRHGLSQSNILTLFQDSRGYIWIGTNGGLNQYDGQDIRIFQHEVNNEKSIPSNLISCIDEDVSGNLWIVTTHGNICKWDRKLETFHTLNENIKKYSDLEDSRILSIFADGDNKLWIGSSNGLFLLHLDVQNEQNHRLSRINLNQSIDPRVKGPFIRQIINDRMGNLWVGTDNGLYQINIRNQDIPFRDRPASHVDLKGVNRVRSLLTTNQGLYIVHQSGISFLSYQEAKLKKPNEITLVSGNYNTIALDSLGYFWAGSEEGVYVFYQDTHTGRFEIMGIARHNELAPLSLSSDQILSLMVDRQGSVWIGTIGGGVSIYSPEIKVFEHYTPTKHPGSIMGKRVNVIYEDPDSNLWISTNNGLSVLPVSSRDNFAEGFINLIKKDPAGRHVINCIDAWKHTNGGLSIICGGDEPHGLSFASLENGQVNLKPFDLDIPYPISAFANVGKRELWVGTYGGGIYRLIHENDRFTIAGRLTMDAVSCHGLSSNIIRRLLEDRNGNVWICTAQGLNLITSSEKFASVPSCLVLKNMMSGKDNMSELYFIDIIQSMSGDIWAGTLGSGLFRISFSDTSDYLVRQMTIAQGLPNNSIKSITEDLDGGIWLSSNRGISRLDPETMNTRSYTLSDGIQDMEFAESASARLMNDKLIFGGINGINIFDPGVERSLARKIQVTLTELSILNRAVRPNEIINRRELLSQSISETDRLRLKFIENSFSFGLTDLQFFRSGNTIFRYRLCGFDEEWVVLGRNERTARYTNVPPGRYLFQVMATDIEGHWEQSETTELLIRIIPPYYRSPLAYIIYFLILIGSLVLYRRFTLIMAEERKQLELERFQKDQTKELTESKITFFTDISHEFRSSLTLIVGSLERMILRWKEISDRDRERYLHLMRRNSHVMLRLIEQLMDFRMLEQGKMSLSVRRVDLMNIIIEVFEVFSQLAQTRLIRFDIECNEHDTELWCDVDKVEKILYNLLSNAFKYVDERGWIRIEVGAPDEADKDDLKMFVKNSGPGIPPGMLNKVFDRFRRMDRDVQSNRVGTGIGLVFTKTLVELHKGSIRVESIENVETCFCVSFLRGSGHFREKDKLKSPGVQSNLTKLTYRKDSLAYSNQRLDEEWAEHEDDQRPVIVIVEDDPEMLHFLTDILSHNYRVYAASYGQQALYYCHKLIPDLVISDVIMPLMDGYELCRQLKSDKRVDHIPLVLLTSKTSVADQIEGLKIGAEAYIAKPFSVDVLEAQIKSLLDARKKARERFSDAMSIDPEEEAYTSLDRRFLEKIFKMIEERINDSSLSVCSISDMLGLSQFQLNKKLKAFTGMTANVFIRNYRLKQAGELIKKNRYFISEIAYEVGFNDLKYFRDCFKGMYNMTPTEYAKKWTQDPD